MSAPAPPPPREAAAAYWRRREQEARERAARAADPQVARIHLDLAERYAAAAGRDEA